MLQNLFLNWLAGMIGKKLDGKKAKIGGIALILAAVLQIIKAIVPDLEIPGLEQVDWDTTFTMARDGLAAFGVGVGAVGVTHKAYKEGLKQPCPPELCPPPPAEEIERRITPGTEPAKKWDGKVPGQFP